MMFLYWGLGLMRPVYIDGRHELVRKRWGFLLTQPVKLFTLKSFEYSPEYNNLLVYFHLREILLKPVCAYIIIYYCPTIEKPL